MQLLRNVLALVSEILSADPPHEQATQLRDFADIAVALCDAIKPSASPPPLQDHQAAVNSADSVVSQWHNNYKRPLGRWLLKFKYEMLAALTKDESSSKRLGRIVELSPNLEALDTFAPSVREALLGQGAAARMRRVLAPVKELTSEYKQIMALASKRFWGY